MPLPSARVEALMFVMPEPEAPPAVQLDALIALLLRSVDESGDYMVAMAILVGQHPELEPVMQESLQTLGLLDAASSLPQTHERTRSLPRRRHSRR